MSRAALYASTALPSGLIDTSGQSIQTTRTISTVDIQTLPLIAEDALPPLPEGIEARLLGSDPESGLNPTIVLWSAEHEVAVEIPLQQMDQVQAAAAKLSSMLAFATSDVA